MMNTISIIIPTRNRSNFIETCLNSLVKELNPEVEVMVVDSSSSDQTREIIKKYPQIKYHYLGDIPYSMVVSRNYGLKYAMGEIIVYIDDDCIVQKNWLTSLTGPFVNPDIVATGGKIIHHPWKNVKHGEPIAILDLEKAKFTAEWDRLVDHMVEVSHLPGGNCAIRKDKALEIGGFDENFTYTSYLEETEFFYRLSKQGGKLMFVPTAIVEHRKVPRTDRLERSNNNYLWRYSEVRNRIYFLVKHKSYPGIIRYIRTSIVDIVAYVFNQFIHAIIFSAATIHGLVSGLLTNFFRKSM